MMDGLLSPDVLHCGCATYDRDIITAGAFSPVLETCMGSLANQTREAIWDHEDHLFECRSCRTSHWWRQRPLIHFVC
jgi:hypothetical protein